MKTGTEDKKKVAMLAGLLLVVAVAAWFELKPSSSPPAPRPAMTQLKPIPQQRTGTVTATTTVGTRNGAAPEAQKISAESFNFQIHLEKLAMSEDVEYLGTGRNIFSTESLPAVPIEPSLAPGRNTDVADTTPVTPQVVIPTAPAIDLKYFGYEQTRDKSMQAFLVHGDDIFMAKAGEIVDHRYKVGTISATTIQITDMAYNNTQNLPLTQN